MSEVMITVRGTHEERVAPERATVTLAVSLDGAEHAEVVTRTLALAEPVRRSIEARVATGTIKTWSSGRLAVRAERPWTNDGSRPPLVHHASLDFTATFSDPDEVSSWVHEMSVLEGVGISATEWTLTSPTRDMVSQRVAAGAVRDAVARASAYAQALGLSTVVALDVADAGLLGQGGSVELRGEDIVVSATVDARFVAR